MSRATVSAQQYIDMGDGSPLTELPEMTELPGLAGPYSRFPLTFTDERIRGELDRLLGLVRDLRPVLREQQEQTEKDGKYAQNVHEFFLEHGFYKLLLPQRYGGLELGPAAFFTVIAEIGRGCPSTAWCMSLSLAHTLTLASYWPEQVQDEIFGQYGYMIAPASGNPAAAKIDVVEGGIMLSGNWRYCSGSPYSTHFFPMLNIPGTDSEPGYRAWAVVEREQYTVLDDWGRIIGMRGSGSNGIRIDEPVFVPWERIVAETWSNQVTEPTVGYAVHGNPDYCGTFFGFAEGEVAAAAVGLGYAALDEYERIIRTSKAPWLDNGALRAELDDYRRVLGMAMAKVDAAAGALFEGGRRYTEYARQLAEKGEAFDAGRSMRLNNQYFIAEELVWEALQHMIRTAGSGASQDGQALQRYFRDIWTTVGRTDQLEVFASPSVRSHFEGAASFAERG